ncbi:ocs element-binding factor 1 [Musa troglodytarum]|uniref:Ocs element-binding factor 1 n=1 Tax=Musa troglodytarum TaxID=320322 RepID=A0A9E7I1S6_9LILI|nr:ocs element-binding factor 1 [Musa troglodytarum]
MLPTRSELLPSECMINPTLQRMSHLVQSFSVVFLYWLKPNRSLQKHQVLMASPGGTSSGSSMFHSSGSSEDLQAAMDEKKRKRMISNRESARRSRLRKQKHLDDLMALANQLRKENSRVLAVLNLTTRHCAAAQAENSVLKAQMMELSSRLESLNEMLDIFNVNSSSSSSFFMGDGLHAIDNSISPLIQSYTTQPIMAAAEHMFHH